MLNRPFWNAMQFILAKTGQAPMGCECDYCEPGEIYQCEGCRREQPYCRGQADEFFEFCDDCWFALPEAIKDPTIEHQGNHHDQNNHQRPIR